MKEGFRQSMAWLHTWTGLVVGWVLFFVFLTGTLGYVQKELTRWMQPEKAFKVQTYPAVSEQMQKAYAWLKSNPDTQPAERWGISFLNKTRDGNELSVNWSQPPAEGQRYGAYQQQVLDPVTGQVPAEQITPRETGGGGALYYMHYALHYIPYDWAFRIVGICTMFMFVAIFTGIITHKKIFKDFFTFRGAKGQRSWLDAHNVLSVTALPFHIMITYSGLLFFMNAYMPLGIPLTYGFGEKNEQRYYAVLYPKYYSSDENKTKLQSLGEIAPTYDKIQPMLSDVERYWGKNNVGSVQFYPAKGEQPDRIEFYKAGVDYIARSRGEPRSYNLDTGALLPAEKGEKAPLKFSSTMLGLHVGWFATPFLRYMYLITGFIGTAMIATGLILWTVKRRPKQIKAGKMTFGHALVERLNIGLVAGLPLGITVYFWANRLLPVAMENRAAWELNALFITMLLVFVYSLFRSIGRVWFEILILTAVSLLLLPIINALTTDKSMWAAYQHADWVLFNIDLGFIWTGLIFVWASYFVWKKRTQILTQAVRQPRTKATPTQKTKTATPSETATISKAHIQQQHSNTKTNISTKDDSAGDAS